MINVLHLIGVDKKFGKVFLQEESAHFASTNTRAFL